MRARGIHWAYGSDDLYLGAGIELPGPERYNGFEQVENGVGSVRYLQLQIAESVGELPTLKGQTIGVVTGTAMGRLLPSVLDDLEKATEGSFELVVLENTLFGPTVTSAGLLPGAAFLNTLQRHAEWSSALLPAESVNDDGYFLDDLTLTDLSEGAPMPLHLSYTFTDVLTRAYR